MNDRQIFGASDVPRFLCERAADAAVDKAMDIMADAGVITAEVYIIVRAVEGMVPEGEPDIAHVFGGAEMPDDPLERNIHVAASAITFTQSMMKQIGMDVRIMPIPIRNQG